MRYKIQLICETIPPKELNELLNVELSNANTKEDVDFEIKKTGSGSRGGVETQFLIAVVSTIAALTPALVAIIQGLFKVLSKPKDKIRFKGESGEFEVPIDTSEEKLTEYIKMVTSPNKVKTLKFDEKGLIHFIDQPYH